MGIIAKLLGIYPGRDGLTLASLQRHTGKALQLDGTDGLTVVGTHQVDLCHLVSSHLPRVLHLKGEVDVRSTGRHFPVDLDVVVLEGGVAQSVSERPLHARVLSDRTIIADGLSKFGIGIADGELGRGGHLAVENISHSTPSFLTGIPRLDDSGTALSQT